MLTYRYVHCVNKVTLFECKVMIKKISFAAEASILIQHVKTTFLQFL